MNSIDYLSMTVQQLLQCPAYTIHQIIERIDLDLLAYIDSLKNHLKSGNPMDIEALKKQRDQVALLKEMLTAHYHRLVAGQLNRPSYFKTEKF
jgi:hypothetical protein